MIFTLYASDNPLSLEPDALVENTPPTVLNRAMLYGEGCFETIRVIDRHIPLWQDHLQRLLYAADVLGISSEFREAPLLPKLQQVFSEIAFTSGKLRLHLLRPYTGGGYAPDSAQTLIWADLEESKAPDFFFQTRGIRLCNYTEEAKPIHRWSNLKHKNAMVSVLAAGYARTQQADDALVSNAEGKIIETSSANLFWIEEGTLYTPPLADGPVAGVFRQFLLREMARHGILIEEKSCTISRLLAAEEVFITNAWQGIRWVQNIGERHYTHPGIRDMAKPIFSLLKKGLHT